MTHEDFEKVAANLAAGFYTDAETLRRFVARAVGLCAENERLKRELDELRQGLEGVIEGLRAAPVVTITDRTRWPGEG